MDTALQLNIGAIVKSSDVLACLSKSVARMGEITLVPFSGPLSDVTPESEFVVNANVLLVDVNPLEPAEVSRLEGLVQALGSAKMVVATAANVTLPDVRRLMRTGVTDVLPQPISEEDFRSVIHNYQTKRQGTVTGGEMGGDGVGKIVTFLKGGGGVGATTLAVQAGCILTQQNESPTASTCIVDFDIQFGTAALYLDLEAKLSLSDLLGAPERLDKSLLDSTVVRHSSGLEVLGAPGQVMALDAISPDFVDGCLEVAKQKYRHVLVDMPGVWTPWTYQILNNTDCIVLVTHLTVSGIRQTKKQLDTLRDSGLMNVPVKVVLNRVDRRALRRIRVKEAEHALGQSIDHQVPDDFETVIDAINQGVALSKIRLKTKVESEISAMVEDVLAELGSPREMVAIQ